MFASFAKNAEPSGAQLDHTSTMTTPALRATWTLAVAALAVCSVPNGEALAQGGGPRAMSSVSHDDVQAYLTAKGMGMARAAERDGVPGPFHALTMAHELGLSAQQLITTQDVFNRMEAQSSRIGRQIIEQERRLDQLLNDPRSAARSREQALQRVGQLHRELRQVHQQAHEAQRGILTTEQLARYRSLRAQAAAVAARPPMVMHATGDTDR